MEMHQVRYFLATVSELNFTKAADKCNVTQPSLTRAIKQLEDELGGDLFRRERPHAQLTELGQRMYAAPQAMLRKRTRGEIAGIRDQERRGRDAQARRIADDQRGIADSLPDRAQPPVRTAGMKLLRGTAGGDPRAVKKRRSRARHAADIDEEWDRLDRWPLFTESFQLLVNAGHRLVSHESVNVDDLRQERFLRSAHCERAEKLASILRSHDLDVSNGHELTSERDLITLLEADFGVAFAPRSTSCPKTLKQAPVNGVELNRSVYLYGVAGRERTPIASAVLKMLRAADWSRYANY